MINKIEGLPADDAQVGFFGYFKEQKQNKRKDYMNEEFLTDVVEALVSIREAIEENTVVVRDACQLLNQVKEELGDI